MHYKAIYCIELLSAALQNTIPHNTAQHCTALHYISLYSIVLPFSALHCNLLHCSVLQYCSTALHCTTVHCTALHGIVLLFNILHCIAFHCTSLHCTAMHWTALHWTALHCTALHCNAHYVACLRVIDIGIICRSGSTLRSPRSGLVGHRIYSLTLHGEKLQQILSHHKENRHLKWFITAQIQLVFLEATKHDRIFFNEEEERKRKKEKNAVCSILAALSWCRLHPGFQKNDKTSWAQLVLNKT